MLAKSNSHPIKALIRVWQDDLDKTGWNVRKRLIVLQIFFVIYFAFMRNLTLYLMLSQVVSEINCYLMECYWIKELNEAFLKIFD